MAILLLALVTGAQGCGDGSSRSGAGDKAACQALAGAKGEDPDIYTALLEMDLSSEMRTALTELRDSTKGGELRSDTFEKAGKLAGLCAAQGVVLSG